MNTDILSLNEYREKIFESGIRKEWQVILSYELYLAILSRDEKSIEKANKKIKVNLYCYNMGMLN